MVGASSCSTMAGSPRSRLRVSRESCPTAVSVSRRRMDAKITSTASSRKTGMRMRNGMTVSVPDQSSKNKPLVHGVTKFCPGPRKNDPIITSTAQNISMMVKIEMANLRFSGLLDGFLSM